MNDMCYLKNLHWFYSYWYSLFYLVFYIVYIIWYLKPLKTSISCVITQTKGSRYWLVCMRRVKVYFQYLHCVSLLLLFLIFYFLYTRTVSNNIKNANIITKEYVLADINRFYFHKNILLYSIYLQLLNKLVL